MKKYVYCKKHKVYIESENKIDVVGFNKEHKVCEKEESNEIKKDYKLICYRIRINE